MDDSVYVGDLLQRAAQVYDNSPDLLAQSAARAWRRGFASGGDWMRQILEEVRNAPLPGSRWNLNLLGLIKYGVAVAGATAWAALAVAIHLPWAALLALPIFYALEAPMVFLFPLALDGCDRPFLASRRFTRRAGGTLAVMRMVLPLAATMLFGGFCRRGFVRSWCLGCIAVCLWYERLRLETAGERSPTRWPLEVGAFRPLHIRHERIAGLGLPQPFRLLYVSDLHLARRTARIAGQVVDAAGQASADLILLGGDLVDSPRGLPLLKDCIERLKDRGPVWAVAGNHDAMVGLAQVQNAVEAGGGEWIHETGLTWQCKGMDVRIDGRIQPAYGPEPRLLCAHDPAIFPQAIAAGYRLVLAGHLHGGQWVLAQVRDRLYPGAWVYRWNGLRFVERGACMLVSRGAHDTLPIRWNCPREALLCEIS